MHHQTLAGACAAALALAISAAAQADQPPGPPPKQPKSEHTLFMTSAQESRDLDSVRLPLYRGTDASGGPVWFVITDASSRLWASRYGVNYSPKLANVIGTGAVMHVDWNNEHPQFPFTPRFDLTRSITPGDPGATDCPAGQSPTRVIDNIPVRCFSFGASGANGQGLATANGTNSYSPLIQLDTSDGPVVLNAPHVANSTGQAGKVIRLEGTDSQSPHVVYTETAGINAGRTIHYVSFDSSIPILAALENVAFAPAVNRSPGTDASPNNATVSGTARSGLIAVTNGPTGLGNPQRQGITSAIFDGASTPLNVVQFTPQDVDGSGTTLYSPLWDIHLAKWIPGSSPTRLVDFQAMFSNPSIEAADGSALHPVRFWMVNCPMVSADPTGTYVVPQPT
jgi:hypothetical protein